MGQVYTLQASIPKREPYQPPTHPSTAPPDGFDYGYKFVVHLTDRMQSRLCFLTCLIPSHQGYEVEPNYIRTAWLIPILIEDYLTGERYTVAQSVSNSTFHYEVGRMSHYLQPGFIYKTYDTDQPGLHVYTSLAPPCMMPYLMKELSPRFFEISSNQAGVDYDATMNAMFPPLPIEDIQSFLDGDDLFSCGSDECLFP